MPAGLPLRWPNAPNYGRPFFMAQLGGESADPLALWFFGPAPAVAVGTFWAWLI